VTTKARINDFFRYSSEHDVHVYQKDYEWYVVVDGVDEEMVFHQHVIDMRVFPEYTDESTHEEITKTMN